MATPTLRRWQSEALERWNESRHRGIVSVVTGAGKTIFALACVAQVRAITTLIVVPTAALLDQWWVESAAFFSLALDEIHVISGNRGIKAGTINLAVLNTAATLPMRRHAVECFLIIDECHKAGAQAFRRVLDLKTTASLGLSATPERPYDDALAQVVVPALGPIIYEYSYADALKDRVIVPFTLKNIVFDLESDRQVMYDNITKSIARIIRTEGHESPRALALLLRRTRILNFSDNRIRLAVKIVAANQGKRVLVFHEDIAACDVIAKILEAHRVPSGVYHSKLSLRQRVEVLAAYRAGRIQVLVTCHALDEGFNVPETEIGIIAASTATRRQRIQRLGRVVRPAKDKTSASIYTLVATSPEIARLKEEESALEGIADVTWGRA